jgi:hypothetical protein
MCQLFVMPDVSEKTDNVYFEFHVKYGLRLCQQNLNITLNIQSTPLRPNFVEIRS